MNEKLWFLLYESLMEKYTGAGTIMDLSITTSIELLSEINGYDAFKMIKALAEAEKEAVAMYQGHSNYQVLIRLRLREVFYQLKNDAEKGLYS